MYACWNCIIAMGMLFAASAVQAQTDSGNSQPPALTLLNTEDQTPAQQGNDKPAVMPATSGAADRMEDLQSFNTYISLEDGQPGQRGELQINYSNGWETTSHESDPWLMTMEVEYSPKASNCWLLNNAKFGINMPFSLGNGAYDGNGDVNLVWKQRLVEESESGGPPTITIENELRTPTGYHSSGVDWTLQGVVAKQVGCGTAVMNAFLKSANGHNNVERTSWWADGCEEGDEGIQHFQWGFRFGYKWRINDCFALLADYVHQTSETEGNHNENIGEIAAEWRVNDHMTIGPGIMFGLDGQDTTPNFGAGVLFHYSWE